MRIIVRSLAILALPMALQGLTSASQSPRAVFDPRSYPKQQATCRAINRATNNTNVDIDINYVEVNPGSHRTMMMVHGWPSLWSSWSHQIHEFESDYHLLVPDLRGFGRSTHPGDVETSGTMGDLVADLVCVMQQAKATSAICLGHDWGSQVCYEAARMRPDIFIAVVGLAIPYIPAAGPFVPISQLIPFAPRLAYQLFFQRNTNKAIVELDADIKRTIRATLRTVDSPPPDSFLASAESFLSAWDGVSNIPPVPFFTSEEEDYFVEEYSMQGFKNTLQFYTYGNRYGSWKFAHEQGNHTIHQPVLSILPLNDRVADWVATARLLHSEEFLPNLTTETLGGAHWVHLEHPHAVNTIIRRWLDRLSLDADDVTRRVLDEL